MLVAPVVNLENSLFHWQVLHPVFQFAIEHGARRVERFVVNTYWQHEMAKQQFGHILAPRHFALCLVAHANVLHEEALGIVGSISQRHIGI